MRCPSCGREIPEGVEVCPYCGARVNKRMGHRALAAFAIALVLIGIAYAGLSASRTLQYVKIGSLNRGMSYSSVQVEGIVTGSPGVYLNPRGLEGISFSLSDGTGELRVRIYGKAAIELVESKRLPSLGDRVSVSGTLLWSSSGYLYLSVNYAESLVIREDLRKFVDMSISEIASASPSDLEQFSMVRVTGVVTAVRPMEYLALYTLEDPETGDSITVVMNGLTRYFLGDEKRAMGNGTVTVLGALKLYGTEWEVEMLTVGGFTSSGGYVQFGPDTEPYTPVVFRGKVESVTSGDPSILPSPFTAVISGVPVQVEAYAPRPVGMKVGDSVEIRGLLLQGPGGPYIVVRALTWDGVAE